MPELSEKTPECSTVSYSRLGTYLECPQKYRNKYVDLVPASKPIEDYFLKGTLAHRILEEFLLGADLDVAIEAILPDWIVNNCNIPLEKEVEVEDGDPYEFAENELDYSLIPKYVYPTADLLVRCSGNYLGEDRIRKADGTVPTDPLNYMPRDFRQAYERLKLQNFRSEIDVQAARANTAFRRFSLANTAAQALSYVKLFRMPEWISHTIAVEYDLIQQPVLWDPGDDTHPPVFWNGAVDWIFETRDGALVIADHKTEKKKPLGIEVLFHSQLNLYAALYYEQTGRLPDYLGINHLPSGELVLAKLDPDVMNQNYAQLEAVKRRIKLDVAAGEFLKALPTKYNSPCIRRDWKSQAVTQVCPYLTNCWPEYAKYVGEELVPFLNEQTLKNVGV